MTEARQADLVGRMIRQVTAHPRVKLLSFHTLNDWGGSLESAARMGLVAWDGRRRPAFDAFSRGVGGGGKGDDGAAGSAE